MRKPMTTREQLWWFAAIVVVVGTLGAVVTSVFHWPVGVVSFVTGIVGGVGGTRLIQRIERRREARGEEQNQ